MNAQTILWISLGSAAGGAARYALAGAVERSWGDGFPWGTLVVNVAGAFAIGAIAAVTAEAGRWPAGPALRHFLMTGVLGGFTTFSAFSLQTLGLLREGQLLRAGAYVTASVAVCLLAVWAGSSWAQALGPSRS